MARIYFLKNIKFANVYYGKILFLIVINFFTFPYQYFLYNM